MIYEPDLVSRRDWIHSQLGCNDRDVAQLRKRIRRHDNLMAHMEITYYTGRKKWCQSPRWREEGERKPVRASMMTEESRDDFVRKGLEHECAIMGMKGSSEETAIELE